MDSGEGSDGIIFGRWKEEEGEMMAATEFIAFIFPPLVLVSCCSGVGRRLSGKEVRYCFSEMTYYLSLITINSERRQFMKSYSMEIGA